MASRIIPNGNLPALAAVGSITAGILSHRNVFPIAPVIRVAGVFAHRDFFALTGIDSVTGTRGKHIRRRHTPRTHADGDHQPDDQDELFHWNPSL
jgi:hypothetical protein